MSGLIGQGTCIRSVSFAKGWRLKDTEGGFFSRPSLRLPRSLRSGLRLTQGKLSPQDERLLEQCARPNGNRYGALGAGFHPAW